MEGNFGLGKSKTLDIFEYLVKNFPDLQIITIAGKNETLKNNFKKILLENGNTKNVRILGYTNRVAELMAISSLVITKPGGLTSTESLVSNVPLIAINPIPGQEEENAEFLSRNQTAIWLKKSDDIAQVFNNVLNNNNLLNQMKENTKKIARPNSTKDICKILIL